MPKATAHPHVDHGIAISLTIMDLQMSDREKMMLC